MVCVYRLPLTDGWIDLKITAEINMFTETEQQYQMFWQISCYVCIWNISKRLHCQNVMTSCENVTTNRLSRQGKRSNWRVLPSYNRYHRAHVSGKKCTATFTRPQRGSWKHRKWLKNRLKDLNWSESYSNEVNRDKIMTSFLIHDLDTCSDIYSF